MMPCVVFAGGCVATEAMLRVCALSGRQTVRQAPAFANANFPSELPSGSRRCRLAGMGQSARNRDSSVIRSMGSVGSASFLRQVQQMLVHEVQQVPLHVRIRSMQP